MCSDEVYNKVTGIRQHNEHLFRVYIVYNCKYWDPSILTAPWTCLTGGLMMTC